MCVEPDLPLVTAPGKQEHDMHGMVPLYLPCSIFASITQVAAAPHSTVLNLGASDAMAGAMGAFLVSHAADRIKTVLFLRIFFKITFIPAAPVDRHLFVIHTKRVLWPAYKAVAWHTSLMLRG
jgi:membrane associated rhomboid family serine protease